MAGRVGSHCWAHWAACCLGTAKPVLQGAPLPLDEEQQASLLLLHHSCWPTSSMTAWVARPGHHSACTLLSGAATSIRRRVSAGREGLRPLPAGWDAGRSVWKQWEMCTWRLWELRHGAELPDRARHGLALLSLPTVLQFNQFFFIQLNFNYMFKCFGELGSEDQIFQGLPDFPDIRSTGQTAD